MRVRVRVRGDWCVFTRAIGDRMLKGQGVIAEPEVRQWRITPADMYLVIASDGLWCVRLCVVVPVLLMPVCLCV